MRYASLITRGLCAAALPVTLALLCVGCGARLGGGSPKDRLVGTWVGTMDLGPKVPIVYEFSADGSEKVMTQNPHGPMSLSGTYTLDGDKLTIEQSTMTGLGQTTSVDSTSTQTIDLSGGVLKLPNTASTMTRLPDGTPPPAWVNAPTSLPPGVRPGTYQATPVYAPGDSRYIPPHP